MHRSAPISQFRSTRRMKMAVVATASASCEPWVFRGSKKPALPAHIAVSVATKGRILIRGRHNCLDFLAQAGFILGSFLLPIHAAETGNSFYSKLEGNLWIGGNASMEIGVDKSKGTVERLTDRLSRENFCDQLIGPGTRDDATLATPFKVGHQIAGLTLYDELKGKEYSDLSGDASVQNLHVESSGEAESLTFQKRFPGAEFVVTESFRVSADHIRWDVNIKKTGGRDRTVRVIQFVPLPLGNYTGWAPISDAPFEVKPYVPFAIEYGQSVSGPVGEGRWRTNIPMIVFYSLEKGRALSLTSPFEVPTVRTRFLNNTGATVDFHWNSRHYPSRERPYLQVSQEYLGIRDKKDIETGLLIATHPADWRSALGWVYSKYREYFDPDPRFEPWDGVYVTGYELTKDTYTEEALREVLRSRRDRGARWEEFHGHFPWYGLMIPGPDVKSWICESHPLPGATLTRQKIADHASRNKEFGIGTFLYYNVTEAEHGYAQKEFPDSIARDEEGQPIGAYRADQYPGKRACWLMNADPASTFGQHMIQQARDLVDAYPALAGFFWDVYGRSYMFDFAHDDGITMVNSKPAYYPEFMYQRLMQEHIRPLLASRGMCVTANKPVTIRNCKGLDAIMSKEDTPEEETPPWVVAQSYLGLNRQVMIYDGQSGTHAELLLLNCLRYGMFYSDIGTEDTKGKPLSPEQIASNEKLVKMYRPFIERFRGKQWIFYPRALELPKNTDGNIFRLKDGSVMITVVSYWRGARHAAGFDTNLPVVCRLPDAGNLQHDYVCSIDLGATQRLKPQLDGDTFRITLPRHGKASVILLGSHPEPTLESSATN
ncbi:MAG TPA: hypothetical protein VMW38_22380 [Terriglobia bacterium]|nr:hypothetical protein [Terriglobia bacterium]